MKKVFIQCCVVDMQCVLIPESEVDKYAQWRSILAVCSGSDIQKCISVTLAHVHVRLCVAREIIAFLKRYTGTRAVRMRIVHDVPKA